MADAVSLTFPLQSRFLVVSIVNPFAAARHSPFLSSTLRFLRRLLPSASSCFVLLSLTRLYQGRESLTDKATSAIKPDSEKSYVEQVSVAFVDE